MLDFDAEEEFLEFFDAFRSRILDVIRLMSTLLPQDVRIVAFRSAFAPPITTTQTVMFSAVQLDRLLQLQPIAADLGKDGSVLPNSAFLNAWVSIET